MLRAEPLYRIRLMLLASEAQDAALVLARFGVFSPAPDRVDALDETPAAAYREAWLEADARLAKLLGQCGEAGPLQVPDDAAAPTLADLEELNDWLKEVWVACMACHEREGRIEEARKHLDALADTLAKLERLNVDLADLLRPDSLLAVDLGSLPAGGLKRVTEALAMTGYLVARFDEAGEQVFAVIAGPRNRHEEVRGLLAQAGWRELPVPDELRTRPQAARAWLEAPVVGDDRRHDAGRAVGGRGHDSAARRILLVDRERERVHPVHHVERAVLGRLHQHAMQSRRTAANLEHARQQAGALEPAFDAAVHHRPHAQQRGAGLLVGAECPLVGKNELVQLEPLLATGCQQLLRGCERVRHRRTGAARLGATEVGSARDESAAH